MAAEQTKQALNTLCEKYGNWIMYVLYIKLNEWARTAASEETRDPALVFCQDLEAVLVERDFVEVAVK